VTKEWDTFLKMAKGQDILYPGAADVLRQFNKDGIAQGLVTGAPMEEIKVLDSNLVALFKVMITGEMTPNHSKPDPEGYNQGKKGLGLLDHQIVAVEDAPLGVQAAKRAGISCIAVTHTTRTEQLQAAGADLIVTTIKEINRSTVERALDKSKTKRIRVA
jgi:HAD superfamily hydrolase (TIGR01509 family)